MPQHPRVSIGLVKDWTRAFGQVQHEDLTELLMVLVTIDATLVRHGRVDQARQLRKAVAKIVEG